VTSSETKVQSHMNQEGGLEKLTAAPQPDGQIRLSVSRREAREREFQEAWGGLSLGNSMKPHLSKLEQDKVGSFILAQRNACNSLHNFCFWDFHFTLFLQVSKHTCIKSHLYLFSNSSWFLLLSSVFFFFPFCVGCLEKS